MIGTDTLVNFDKWLKANALPDGVAIQPGPGGQMQLWRGGKWRTMRYDAIAFSDENAPYEMQAIGLTLRAGWPAPGKIVVYHYRPGRDYVRAVDYWRLKDTKDKGIERRTVRYLHVGDKPRTFQLLDEIVDQAADALHRYRIGDRLGARSCAASASATARELSELISEECGG